MLIFPEGVTQDDPYLAPVKTGAARIALGARAAGTAGIAIQPVGIHYEDKAAFRSRVLVAFGSPIDVDQAVGGMDESHGVATADNRAAVDELNAVITDGMTHAAPNYRDWDEAGELHLGSTVALRQTTAQQGADVGDVPLALSEQLGARLAAREPERRRPVQEAARRYRASLAGLRMSDYQLSGSTSTARLVGRLAVDGLLMLLLLPYAVIGVVLGAIPYLLVQATRLIPAAPAVRATILPLAALLVFLVEWVWLAVAVGNARGVWFGAVVALLVPFFLGATVIVAERAVLVWRTLRSWVAARRVGQPVTAARQQRAELLDAVRRAL